MCKCCPVLAAFDIRMLKMLTEMIQFTYASEKEIAVIFQSKFQTQKSKAKQHLIQCTGISVLWFWTWQQQQLITSTFLHYRRKAFRRKDHKVRINFLTTVNQNIKTWPNDMLLNHSECLVCTPTANLRLAASSWICYGDQRLRSPNTELWKTGCWMWWHGTSNSGQEPRPWPTWPAGMDTLS